MASRSKERMEKAIAEEDAKTSPDGPSRTIMMSSSIVYFLQLGYNVFRAHPKRKQCGRHDLYDKSKLVSPLPYLSLRHLIPDATGKCPCGARSRQAVRL